MERKPVGNEIIDRREAPCGGANSVGVVHFATRPGSRNLVGWKVINPAPEGNCSIRLGIGPNENEFVTLYPIDGSADDDGTFPCGRVQTPFEAKEFKFPKNFTCDDCALQLEWRTNSKDQNI